MQFAREVIEDVERNDGVELFSERNLHQIGLQHSRTWRVVARACDLLGGHVDGGCAVMLGDGLGRGHPVPAADLQDAGFVLQERE